MKNVIIPVPDNPLHVDNLRSTELLQAQGWVSMDRDPAVSLFEYGLAWNTAIYPDEVAFIYCIRAGDDERSRWFDRCSMASDTDVRKEYSWADFDAVLRFCDGKAEDWEALPLEAKIADLLNYYGTAEIFGESYWEGFQIVEGHMSGWTDLHGMLNSSGWNAFQGDKLGNSLCLEDEERFNRIMEASKDGADGSTHAECLADMSEYLELAKDEIAPATFDKVQAEIQTAVAYHESKGTLDNQVG